MRRSSDLWHRLRRVALFGAVGCAAVLGAPLLGGCEGAAAEVSITLTRDPGSTLDGLGALRFIVRDLSADSPAVYGPVATGGTEPLVVPATVTPGTDFYVDVWGCPSTERCSPADVLARGCTPVLNVQGDQSIEVVIFDVSAAGAAACPPA
jgi:hypothetical protein